MAERSEKLELCTSHANYNSPRPCGLRHHMCRREAPRERHQGSLAARPFDGQACSAESPLHGSFTDTLGVALHRSSKATTDSARVPYSIVQRAVLRNPFEHGPSAVGVCQRFDSCLHR